MLVPRGYFVPVSPGTRYVTVGGAIASDIHGKNHHVDGSFGTHVRRMSLLLADGTTAELAPDVRPDLFWATVGGMGLTGIILDATIALLRIETSRCAVDTTRAADLDALMALMDDGDRYFRYSVAWVDLLAKGARLGRGVLTRGDHATTDQLAATRRRRSARLRAPAGRRGAPARSAAGRAQPRQPRRVQRDVVPQGPAPAHRPDLLDPGLLPPARLDHLVEPAVRAAGVPAVPVRRPVRRRGRAAHRGRAARRRGHAQLPVGAQALRRRQSGTAQLPGARAGRSPSTSPPRRAGSPPCCTASTTWCSRQAVATTWPRTPTPPRPRSGGGIPRLDEWRAVRAAADPAGVWASDQSRRLRLLED